MKLKNKSLQLKLSIIGCLLALFVVSTQAQVPDSTHPGVLILQLQLEQKPSGIEARIQNFRYIPKHFQQVDADTMHISGKLRLRIRAANSDNSRYTEQYINDPFFQTLEYADELGRLQKIRRSVPVRNLLIRLPLNFLVHQIELYDSNNQKTLNTFKIPSELFKQQD